MPQTTEQVRAMVRERFSRIARAPAQEKKFPIGPESASRLGYESSELDGLPATVTESFSGVGNPFSLGEIHPGETVLDLGCGAGLDSFFAARRVGPAGKVIAVDMTSQMIDKARRNAVTLGIHHVEFLLGEIEDLPLADAVADVPTSNVVFNLCTDKPRAVAETYRVLKPGGRLLMADILLEDRVTTEEVARLGTWSD